LRYEAKAEGGSSSYRLSFSYSCAEVVLIEVRKR